MCINPQLSEQSEIDINFKFVTAKQSHSGSTVVIAKIVNNITDLDTPIWVITSNKLKRFKTIEEAKEWIDGNAINSMGTVKECLLRML